MSNHTKENKSDPIMVISDDPRVNNIRVLARQLRMNAALTPELQEAISDLNAEAAMNFNRNLPKGPRKHA